MFLGGDLDARFAQFLPGGGDQCAQGGVVFWLELVDGLFPVSGFEVGAQAAEGGEKSGVDGEGGEEAEPDRRQEAVFCAVDAAAWAGFDQSQHAGHLELFAQLAHADAGFGADLRQRWQPFSGRVAVSQQVVQKIGLSFWKNHKKI